MKTPEERWDDYLAKRSTGTTLCQQDREDFIHHIREAENDSIKDENFACRSILIREISAIRVVHNLFDNHEKAMLDFAGRIFIDITKKIAERIRTPNSADGSSAKSTKRRGQRSKYNQRRDAKGR